MTTLFRILTIVLTCCLMLSCQPTSTATEANVTIEITDPAPFHIHRAGQPIELSLLASSVTKVTSLNYQWVNHRGIPVSDVAPVELNKTIRIASPPLPTGYYGLQISADNSVLIEDRVSGEAMEYGFSVQGDTKKQRLGRLDQFGMVHADLSDPTIPSWIKTMTWQTASPGWWDDEMQERQQLGLLELPIVMNGLWESNDNQPITEQQLNKLGEEIKQYFEADHSVLHWELGLEENLTGRYHQEYYWQNLAAKAKRVRKIADLVNPEIRLIFQVESLKLKVSSNFLKSEAAQYFDILSLHPYSWPNFPMPEKWLPTGLDKIKQEMANYGKDFPIWFTEVGAPHHGNHSGGFFGYPEDQKKVDGLSRANAVSYLIQLHAVAFSAGVEKVFWYNYHDRFHNREHAEANFGLIDHLGYPKPVYTAYNTLHNLLQGKTAMPARQTNQQLSGMSVYSFEDEIEAIDIIWSSSENRQELDTKIFGSKSFRIKSAMGADLTPQDRTIKVDNEPVYIIYSKQ